jgi:hypothetical protein
MHGGCSGGCGGGSSLRASCGFKHTDNTLADRESRQTMTKMMKTMMTTMMMTMMRGAMILLRRPLCLHLQTQEGQNTNSDRNINLVPSSSWTMFCIFLFLGLDFVITGSSSSSDIATTGSANEIYE